MTGLPPTTPVEPEIAASSFRYQSAWRTAQISLGVSLLFFAYNLYTASLDPVWQQFSFVGVSGWFVLASSVGLLLIRRNRQVAGIVWILLGVAAVILAIPFFYTGLGLIAAIAGVLFFSVVSQSLPNRLLGRGTLLGIGLGLAAYVVDTLNLPWRATPVSNPSTSIAVAGTLLFFYAIFIFRNFRRYPLAAKLVLSFVLASILSAGAVGAFTLMNVRDTMQRQIGENLQALANTQGVSVGNLLEQQVNALKALAQGDLLQEELLRANRRFAGQQPTEWVTTLRAYDRQWRTLPVDDPQIQSIVNSVVAQHLREFGNTFSGNLNLLVTDRYGALLASSNPLGAYYYADTQWWQRAYNDGLGALYLGQPALDPTVNQMTVILAVPVYDREGKEVLGVVRSVYGLSDLVALLKGAAFGNTGQAELYLPSGVRISEDGRQILPGGLSVGALQALQEQAGSLSANYNDTPSVISASRVRSLTQETTITNLGWVVVLHQHQTESLRLLDNLQRLLVLIVLIIIGFVTSIGLGITQVMVNPITRLADVARQISAGDLSARIHAETEDEIGDLSNTFNAMAAQLSQTLNGLEQTVSERTAAFQRRSQQLAAAAEVGKAAASIRQLDNLLTQITQLISRQFDFYHVGIFLLDESGKYAILRAANSTGGQRMLARGHRLAVGQTGIVGYVTGQQMPRIALDVGEDATFFNNPDLPDTRSEMALPLIAGGNLLGALDVQSTQSNAFSQEDVEVLQLLADQVATAIENARLFEQTQQALNATRQAYGELTRQGWLAMLQGGQSFSYRSVERTLPGSAAQEAVGEILNLPIQVRGAVIGSLETHKPVGQAWTLEERETLQNVLEQMAIAIESARLYEESQLRAENERLVSDIAGRLRSTLDLSSVLQTAAREIQQAMNLAEVELRLGPSAPLDLEQSQRIEE
ncbi:MAG: hypothetical protein OHK0052_00140 [Anaerolineales bacterium]